MKDVKSPFPPKVTNGDKYGPAMEITEQAEADAWFERCVKHSMHCVPSLSRGEAEKMERENLGYYAGYCSTEVRARVERLFRCAHPFFGTIERNGPPDPQTAMNIGMAIGHALKLGKP
jgi:hypothetical protein